MLRDRNLVNSYNMCALRYILCRAILFLLLRLSLLPSYHFAFSYFILVVVFSFTCSLMSDVVGGDVLKTVLLKQHLTYGEKKYNTNTHILYIDLY